MSALSSWRNSALSMLGVVLPHILSFWFSQIFGREHAEAPRSFLSHGLISFRVCFCFSRGCTWGRKLPPANSRTNPNTQINIWAENIMVIQPGTLLEAFPSPRWQGRGLGVGQRFHLISRNQNSGTKTPLRNQNSEGLLQSLTWEEGRLFPTHCLVLTARSLILSQQNFSSPLYSQNLLPFFLFHG